MKKQFFLVWIACISFFPIYNILGEKIFILGLAIPILMSHKIRVKRNLLISTLLFFVFFSIKLIPAIFSYNPLSKFHSVFTLFAGVFEMFVLFLLFDSVDFTDILATSKSAKQIRLFTLICYHSSILLTLIMMAVRGKNFYRDDISVGGILVAPQFCLLESIIISSVLTYEAIKKKDRRYVNIVCVIINAIYIVLANYATQMLFFFAGVVLAIVLAVFDAPYKRIIGTIIIVGLTLYIENYLPTFILFIDRRFFSDNPTMHMRLNEIYMMLMYREAGTDLNGRMNLMQLSFNTFKENVLFGVPFSKYNTVATGLKVGGHSEWPDDLARYGLVGMSLWLFFIYGGVKNIFIKLRMKKEYIACICMILSIYGFANPAIKPYSVCAIIISGCILGEDQDSERT